MQAISYLVLYWPAAQAVHVVAPTALPVLVIDPALQLAHAVVGAALNLPLGHAEQTRLRVASGVWLVYCPAWQVLRMAEHEVAVPAAALY